MRVLGGWESPNGPTAVVKFTSLDEELRFLRKMVTQYRTNPAIRDLALKIIRDAGVESRDKKTQALAIGDWVQTAIYYVHELPERYQTPTETLRTRAGDCDDSTTLVASLLESVGIPSALVCMQINGQWRHIFPAAVMQRTGALLPLDTTMRTGIYIGKSPVEWAQERGKRVALKIA